LAVSVEEYEDENIEISIKILNRYLELEPVGPFIAGDLVLQGYSLEQFYGPAICKVEFLSSNDDHGEYSELLTIMPWEMIYQPADEETGNPDSFAIPITLPSHDLEGTAHLTVYVDIASKTPYSEPPPSSSSSSYLPNNPQLITAIDFFTPVSFHATTGAGAGVGAGGMEGDEEETNAYHSRQGTYQIITSIKSASHQNSDLVLNSNHLSLCPVIDMTNGLGKTPEGDGDGKSWKFSIAVEQNDETTHLQGLEDALFVVRDNDTGELDVPEGYEVDSSNLLEDCPDAVSPPSSSPSSSSFPLPSFAISTNIFRRPQLTWHIGWVPLLSSHLCISFPVMKNLITLLSLSSKLM
jgi:hypothetical protein